MSEMNWIPLTEYAMKHKVSISTLRRRIKAETIQFLFEAGKYLILDTPIQSHQTPHRPSQLRAQDNQNWAPQPSEPGSHDEDPGRKSGPEESRSLIDEPVLTTAQTLLAEIKQAYRQILQEKEEQIMILKDQLNDSRTLIRVLESENRRLSERSSANLMDI